MKPFLLMTAAVIALGSATLSAQAQSAKQDSNVYHRGLAIYDLNGREVGSIDRMVIASDGSPWLVARVGSYLGSGSRDVLVRPQELTPMGSPKGTKVTMTAGQIEALPDFMTTTYARQGDTGRPPAPTPHDSHGS